jgi:glycosyltransferase involved in cell wall biosynthesis
VLVSEKDHGIYDALNKGIGLASGEVIVFLHADDLFADDRVISRVAIAFADPAVYGDLVYVSKNETGRVIRHWRVGTFSPSRLARAWMQRTHLLRQASRLRAPGGVRHEPSHRSGL